MDQLPIDVDAEAIFFDGSWYTREDLARKVKSMIDASDFNVARPSAALEALSSTLAQVRTLSFRVTPDLANALDQLAARSGNSIGQLVREAVMQMLTQVPALGAHDPVRAPDPTSPEPPKRTVSGNEPTVVVAGPGALRNAGLEPGPQQPIELTKRVEPSSSPSSSNNSPNNSPNDSIENRWFKQ